MIGLDFSDFLKKMQWTKILQFFKDLVLGANSLSATDLLLLHSLSDLF